MDAVTLEIMHGKLLATVDEMGMVLARTSMSPVIYEVLDFACGICDADGDLVAQANGLTLFTGNPYTPSPRFLLKALREHPPTVLTRWRDLLVWAWRALAWRVK